MTVRQSSILEREEPHGEPGRSVLGGYLHIISLNRCLTRRMHMVGGSERTLKELTWGFMHPRLRSCWRGGRASDWDSVYL